MAKQYRSSDERVLHKIIDNCEPGEKYISRTRARYGMLSMSAGEFDEVLERHGVTVSYNANRGQQYLVAEVLVALTKLTSSYEKISDSPFVFSLDPSEVKSEEVQ